MGAPAPRIGALAIFVCGCAGPAAAAPYLPFSGPGVSIRTEAEATAAAEAAEAADFRNLAFSDVEHVIRKGWWKAALAVVARSHGAKLDFTAPVRRATNEVKREADALIKWLDPQFANPAPTPMAMRWAQNKTVVMLAARLAPRWDLPGANIAVFSTEHGRGHVDRERTAQAVREMLRVDFAGSRVSADITAEAGSARKRYTLDVPLFDEAVPEHSRWLVEFRRAQGSMQMSRGAEIPELHIFIQKRWPELRPWPRLTTAPPGAEGLDPDPWPEAPGGALNAPPLRPPGQPAAAARAATPLTCSRSDTAGVYCPAKDACVPECGQCAKAAQLHSSASWCVTPPRVRQVQRVSFVDMDPLPGVVAGDLEWQQPAENVAESYALHWGAGPGKRLLPPGAPPLLSFQTRSSAEPLFRVPRGTPIPPGAAWLHVVVANEAGEDVIAHCEVVDRVRPPSVNIFQLTDTDVRQGWIRGTVELGHDYDGPDMEKYELHFGQLQKDGGVGYDKEADPMHVTKESRVKTAGGVTVKLEIGAHPIPKAKTHLVALAVTSDDLRSEEQAVLIRDSCPPTIEPKGLHVGKDVDPRKGYASFTLRVSPASCDPADSGEKEKTKKKKARDAKVHSVTAPCDAGQSYALYWLAANKTRLGPAIDNVTATQLEKTFVDVPVPAGASALAIYAQNDHGEMKTGPSSRLADNKTENLLPWRGTSVLAAGSKNYSLVSWHAPALSGKPLFSVNFSVTAVVADPLGHSALVGGEDGVVTVLDLAARQVERRLPGSGRVSALALDHEGMRALRGAAGGALDIWDLGTGSALGHLVGHNGSITGLDVDWAAQRAASASLDGTVRIWDLQNGACTRTLNVHEGGVTSLAVDWAGGRMLSATQDEALQLLDAQSGERLMSLDGHSEAVGLLAVGWEQMLALSASADRRVKLWDLQAREATISFTPPGKARILAVRAKWESMLALAVLEDGTVSFWDLRGGGAEHEALKLGQAVTAAAILSP